MKIERLSDGRIVAIVDVHPRTVLMADAKGMTVEEWLAYMATVDGDYAAHDEPPMADLNYLVTPWFADWPDARFAADLFDAVWDTAWTDGNSLFTDPDHWPDTDAEAREQLQELFDDRDAWPPRDAPTDLERSAMTAALEAALKHDVAGIRESLRPMFDAWLEELRLAEKEST